MTHSPVLVAVVCVGMAMMFHPDPSKLKHRLPRLACRPWFLSNLLVRLRSAQGFFVACVTRTDDI